MEKIKRRFFIGAAVFSFTWLLWFSNKTRPARAFVSDQWRKLHRWRHGMQPRWVDWSSTETRRFTSSRGQVVPYEKVTTTWKELRWPDNDELVEKTEPVVTKDVMVPDPNPLDRAAKRYTEYAELFRVEFPNGLSVDASHQECERYYWLQACFETVKLEELRKDPISDSAKETLAILDAMEFEPVPTRYRGIT